MPPSQVDISGVKPSVPYCTVGVRVGVAVGGVELGGDVRVVSIDRRILVRAGHRFVDHIVRRRRADLPANAVEQQLRCGVVVDEELEPDPPNRPSSAWVSGSEFGPVPRYVSLAGSGEEPSLSYPTSPRSCG